MAFRSTLQILIFAYAATAFANVDVAGGHEQTTTQQNIGHSFWTTSSATGEPICFYKDPVSERLVQVGADKTRDLCPKVRNYPQLTKTEESLKLASNCADGGTLGGEGSVIAIFNCTRGNRTTSFTSPNDCARFCK